MTTASTRQAISVHGPGRGGAATRRLAVMAAITATVRRCSVASSFAMEASFGRMRAYVSPIRVSKAVSIRGLGAVMQDRGVACRTAFQREPVGRSKASPVIEHERLLRRHVPHEPVDRPGVDPGRHVNESAVQARFASGRLRFAETLCWGGTARHGARI